MTTKTFPVTSSVQYLKKQIIVLRNIIKRNLLNDSKTSNGIAKPKFSSSFHSQNLFQENHNSCEGVSNNAVSMEPRLTLNIKSRSDDEAYVGNTVHYVDACSLWKFPEWLITRMECSNIIDAVNEVNRQEARNVIMFHLKASSTDLLLYETVRREFLRSILVIELINVSQLLEKCTTLDLDVGMKANFFSSLQNVVDSLEVDSKPYGQSFNNLADAMDAIFLDISPSINFRELDSYDYNIMYCSYLVPGNVLQLIESCGGGIVDNTWFSLESKYSAMVMVTPHVYDDPNRIQVGALKSMKYRVEAYFDVNKGHYLAFDKHFKSLIPITFRSKIILEHLVFNFFMKNDHIVEEKSVFLMNGPETIGNSTFAKIYHALCQATAL